jgi:hypothetical protein
VRIQVFVNLRTVGPLLCISFAAIFTSATSAGCAAAGEEAAQTGDDANFTIASGDRFIVSATPEKIVFKKKIGNADFPFDAESLKGKAILIHPVASKAADGVYSRAKTVRSEGDNLVVDAVPLTFLEMEEAKEDDIVRIYVDEKRSTPDGHAKAYMAPAAIRPLNIVPAFGLSPLSEGEGLPFGDMDMGSGADTPIAKANKLSPGISFGMKIEKAAFNPDLLLDWSREKGLELGFRASMDWKSSTTINGSLTGEFFRSNAWESPGLWFTLPLGFIGVPIKANAKVLITCKATIVGPADVTIGIDAHAAIGGSFRVRPSRDTEPSTWVSAGSWPGESTGSVSIDPGIKFAVRGSVFCALPRIELRTKVFGVAGPLVVISPTAVMSTEGVAAEVRFAAGLEAGLFGIGAGLEVPVYTYPIASKKIGQ